MTNFMKIGYQLWPVEGKQFLVANPTAAPNFDQFQRFSIGRNFACNDSIVFKFGMDHPHMTTNHHCKFDDNLLKTFWRRPKYLENGASN